MQVLRADARRLLTARRARPSAVACTRVNRPAAGAAPATRSPRRSAPRVRAILAVLAAPLTVAATIALTVLLGFSPWASFAVTAVVAVVGGALAHRTISGLLAGVMLLLARPFAPGDRLRLYVPELGGVVEAELLRLGLLTTTLCTPTGVLVVPNHRLLQVPPPGAPVR